MYQNVSQLTFIDQFTRMGRKSQFSYPALVALFEYYEELEASTGQPIELDVIGICCDWEEHSNLDETLKAYDFETMMELEGHTTVIELPGSWLLQTF